MLIDWFTVGAQALNFIILVWLLKRFLYKPVLDAIDAREKRIAAALADADQMKAEAQKKQDAYQQKNDEFDRQREEMISKVAEEAKAEHDKLTEESRTKIEAELAARKKSMQDEMHKIQKSITQLTRSEVLSISRKTLSDLAGVSLEDRIVEVFVTKLCSLKGENLDQFVAAMKTDTTQIYVRTAFGLSEDQKNSVEAAFNKAVSDTVQLQFETAPDIVSGIELRGSGQKVSWSIDGYLSTLEDEVNQLFADQPIVEPKSDDKSPQGGDRLK